MRTIKFRAWSKRNGFYINDVQDAYCGTGPEEPFDCFGDALNDDNYDVEQFTGLKDIENVKIYENDIVEFDCQEWPAGYYREVLYTGVIEFKDSAFILRVKETPKLLGGDVAEAMSDSDISGYEDFEQSRFWLHELENDSLTVIGNVHENPELLKKVEQ